MSKISKDYKKSRKQKNNSSKRFNDNKNLLPELDKKENLKKIYEQPPFVKEFCEMMKKDTDAIKSIKHIIDEEMMKKDSDAIKSIKHIIDEEMMKKDTDAIKSIKHIIDEEMMKKDTDAIKSIKHIIDESIINILLKKLLTKIGVIVFLLYHVIVLILYKKIPLDDLCSILKSLLSKILT